MNQKRINKVLEKMEERGIDYLLVTDPVSIDYLLDYVNHPGERMYVMVLSSKGNHQLFFNNLFYVGEDLGMPITWFDDTDNGPALLADYLKDAKVIGVDKNMYHYKYVHFHQTDVSHRSTSDSLSFVVPLHHAPPAALHRQYKIRIWPVQYIHP